MSIHRWQKALSSWYRIKQEWVFVSDEPRWWVTRGLLWLVGVLNRYNDRRLARKLDEMAARYFGGEQEKPKP